MLKTWAEYGRVAYATVKSWNEHADPDGGPEMPVLPPMTKVLYLTFFTVGVAGEKYVGHYGKCDYGNSVYFARKITCTVYGNFMYIVQV
jgi:hypothetical protein